MNNHTNSHKANNSGQAKEATNKSVEQLLRGLYQRLKNSGLLGESENETEVESVAATQADSYAENVHAIWNKSLTKFFDRAELDYENDDIASGFARHLTGTLEHTKACLSLDLRPYGKYGEPIKGTMKLLPTVEYCTLESAQRRLQGESVWAIRTTFSHLKSKADFSSAVAAQLERMEEIANTLKALEKYMGNAPGNKNVYSFLMPEQGYIQDVNGLVLYGGDLRVRPTLNNGTGRYPGSVQKDTLKNIVARWEANCEAGQFADHNTLKNVVNSFAFDSMKATEETEWKGTAKVDGKKSSAILRFEEAGPTFEFTKQLNYQPLLNCGPVSQYSPAMGRIQMQCEWIHVPQALREAMKKKCPAIADQIPHFFTMEDGSVAELARIR